MAVQTVFRRYELKYLINTQQYDALHKAFGEYMVHDKFAKTTIANIYYDTPSYQLIRRSLEKPVYKEKLRVRRYIGGDNQDVYVELKKKYKKVVYKRRVRMSEAGALAYLEKGIPPNTNRQILLELDYVRSFYPNLGPAMFLSYEREAFCGKADMNFRVTFDNNILWRTTDLERPHNVYGEALLPNDTFLMEVKTVQGIPLWLARLLSEQHIYTTSFSKYGTAYKALLNTQTKERLSCQSNYSAIYLETHQHSR